MISAVADTHTVIWYLYDDTRLSEKAKQLIEDTKEQGNQIGISTITLVEIVYLIEKGRIKKNAFSKLNGELKDNKSVLGEIPLTNRIVIELAKIDRDSIPDMPDRIIAATASHLNVPLLSRDEKIKISQVETIW
ncbi:MAG: PIN domain-containing protein [Candidatus Aminicenantes bacterium]|nr:PIN domain-containing protein [Candidatus Aminicenantes bacterium]NIM83554.1 PIN domain-containing protein [Candidatus Aminicenantes bacterium]NIN22954.1 PIN domain-containing protein [Candidatus Aminicenantes bacterium]NIN46691.1 PIN domain-containing protein [Candidatus Aminicenantes bacterium]NIN89597.1 PIN domain-containing protein [Candidatus Aminicenantes bacterium]